MKILGSATANTLSFSAITLTGIASIDGGAGDDSLTGTNGDDVFIGGPGNDTIRGGGGNDTAKMAAPATDGYDSVTGDAGIDTIEATGGATTIGLRSIATLEQMTPNGLHVEGSAGNDTTLTIAPPLAAGIPADVDGKDGNDTITGSVNADVLLGSAGTDTLNGGNGDDRITGGEGNDTLNGGLNNDRLVFGPSFGADTVATGFDANPAGGQDLLDISALGITSATFGSSVTIATATTAPTGTHVTIGANSIRLTGVAASAVTAQDFVLAP